MKRTTALYLLTFIFLMLTGGVASLHAQNVPTLTGRLGYLEGAVSFFADPQTGWQPARVNYPVTSENSVWVENAGRAEVRVGAHALRFGDHTVADFTYIDEEATRMFLQRGVMTIRTRSDRATQQESGKRLEHAIEVSLVEGRVVVDSPSRLRIEIVEGGAVQIAVFSGSAQFLPSGSGVLRNITQGQALSVNDIQGGARFSTASETSMDRWAAARDYDWDSAHTRTVREGGLSPWMTGYEDLDRNGEWVVEREYGRVWVPRHTIDGWAPYRYGTWVNVNPWGWTWVDDAPWGFAPFHYGRWVRIGSRWAWWPGSYVRRPVYAPALVAWFGDAGSGVSVSIGRTVGWFPLAPRENYIPWYSRNETYVRRINHVERVTVVRPPQRYVHQTPGATFVNATTFTPSRPVQAQIISVPVAGQGVVNPVQVPPRSMENHRRNVKQIDDDGDDSRALRRNGVSNAPAAPQAAAQGTNLSAPSPSRANGNHQREYWRGDDNRLEGRSVRSAVPTGVPGSAVSQSGGNPGTSNVAPAAVPAIATPATSVSSPVAAPTNPSTAPRPAEPAAGSAPPQQPVERRRSGYPDRRIEIDREESGKVYRSVPPPAARNDVHTNEVSARAEPRVPERTDLKAPETASPTRSGGYEVRSAPPRSESVHATSSGGKERDKDDNPVRARRVEDRNIERDR